MQVLEIGLLVLGALLFVAAAVIIYRLGLRDGARMAAGQPPAAVKVPRPCRAAPVPEDVQRLNDILANVERYDGTEQGQKVVE